MSKEKSTRRLCSEIQLFDLCDLDRCTYKDDRYCTKEDLLARFEGIKEEDERSPQQYLSEELDEEEGGDDLEYGDGYGDDDYQDQDDDQ